MRFFGYVNTKVYESSPESVHSPPQPQLPDLVLIFGFISLRKLVSQVDAAQTRYLILQQNPVFGITASVVLHNVSYFSSRLMSGSLSDLHGEFK